MAPQTSHGRRWGASRRLAARLDNNWPWSGRLRWAATYLLADGWPITDERQTTRVRAGDPGFVASVGTSEAQNYQTGKQVHLVWRAWRPLGYAEVNDSWQQRRVVKPVRTFVSRNGPRHVIAVFAGQSTGTSGL